MNTSNVQESMVCGGWRWVLPCLVALLGVLLAPAVVEAATKERIRFHVQDHAGSTMRVLTPEGFVVAKYRYSPFGEQLADKVATADRVRSAYVSGIQERNDLLYLKHRYYNPVIGRFYQPDPVGFLAGGQSQINRYAYGLNDPYTFRDPSGQSALDVLSDDGLREILFNDAMAVYSLLKWDVDGWNRHIGISNQIADEKFSLDFLGGILLDTVNPADYVRDIKKLGAVATTTDKFSRAPKSLMDQMVLDAAKQGKGVKIIDNLGDPKFKGMEKWSYTERSANGILSEVHYVRDPTTGKLMDFKFKHHADTGR